jgi:hypothetical protein
VVLPLQLEPTVRSLESLAMKDAASAGEDIHSALPLSHTIHTE